MVIAMLCDTHCHLTLLCGSGTDIYSIIQRALKSEISFIVDISVGTGDFMKRREMIGDVGGRYGIELFMTAGIPPFHAGRRVPGDLDLVKKQAGEEKVVGVGEIGLDFHHDYASKARQIDLFVGQLDLANELGLPVIVHSREADAELVDTLKRHRALKGGIIHCFSSSVETARPLLDLGFYLSFAGNLTYRKSDSLREVARFMPSDRYLIETDAPYLSPEGYRGKTNEPALLEVTARFLAAVRGITFEALACETTRNAKAALGLGSATSPP